MNKTSRHLLNRDMADREPRTWLGYARNAARHEPGDDEQVEQWLQQARADTALAGDADTLADAWQQLAADHRAFLNTYAADCPEGEAYNGTRDAVRRSAGSPQRQIRCGRPPARVDTPEPTRPPAVH
ncbi:hypothetical protein [Streptomyces collinus]|uniref:hypothetical protein n=1 Tax=Streptomyces collinus TaxID=42684 RepID=UPI0036CF4ED3